MYLRKRRYKIHVLFACAAKNYFGWHDITAKAFVNIMLFTSCFAKLQCLFCTCACLYFYVLNTISKKWGFVQEIFSLSVWNTKGNIPRAVSCKKAISLFHLWPEVMKKDKKFTRFLEIAIHQEIHFVTGYAHLSPTSIRWGLREVWSTLCSRERK